MLSWSTSRPRGYPKSRGRPVASRYFSSYVGYFVVAWNFSCAAVPLFAQSVDTSDSTTPAAPNPPPTPPPAATPPPTTPPPQNSAVSTAEQSAASTVEAGAFSAAAGPTPVTGPGAVLTPVLGDHLGSAYTSERLPFRVTAALGEVYNDNIFAEHRDRVYDYITRLSARGEYQVGNLLSVDGNYLDALYNPSLHLYARNPHENGVDQDVDVFYAHHFSRLTLSLEQIYSSIQNTNASVGGLVTTDDYATTAMAKFGYSAKLDFVASFKQEFIDYDVPGYTNSKEWSGQFYSLYHLDDKLSFGFGPRIGYLILQDAPDENFQQVLARVIYVPNEKLTVQAAAGGEDREYQSAGRSDTLTPIFEFMGVYLPYSTTTIILNAARRFTPAYSFTGENYLATNVNLNATQRLLRNYYFGLTAGYENDDYKYVAAAATGPTREDNYFYLQPTASWKPNAALAVAVFYQYEEDSSNFTIFSYDTNQLGVSFSATY